MIIDSFIGLDEFIEEDQSYQKLYPVIKDLRDFIIERGLVCIILHHTKKGEANWTRIKLIGSKQMTGANYWNNYYQCSNRVF